uniref:Uncharacterized protein n=1 Tax=Panagrolaimus sp. PS1159 TaxID=55785 RepID=A0AC35F2T9_9BILA
MLLAAVIRIGYAILYYIFENEHETIFIILNLITPFLTQILRNFFLSILIERIIATIYFQNYTISNKISLFYTLSVPTYILAILYSGFLCYNRFVLFLLDPTVLLAYTTAVIHIITLFTCIILHYLNTKLFKASAYRVSLEGRHQMVENVKVLKFMFPFILIYAIIAPFGALTTIIGFTYNLNIPYCFFHIFNNLPHLIICIRFSFVNSRKLNTSKIMAISVVENAMGKHLPVTQDSDKYFLSLQKQWN